MNQEVLKAEGVAPLAPGRPGSASESPRETGDMRSMSRRKSEWTRRPRRARGGPSSGLSSRTTNSPEPLVPDKIGVSIPFFPREGQGSG